MDISLKIALISFAASIISVLITVIFSRFNTIYERKIYQREKYEHLGKIYSSGLTKTINFLDSDVCSFEEKLPIIFEIHNEMIVLCSLYFDQLTDHTKKMSESFKTTIMEIKNACNGNNVTVRQHLIQVGKYDNCWKKLEENQQTFSEKYKRLASTYSNIDDSWVTKIGILLTGLSLFLLCIYLLKLLVQN